MRPTGQDVDSKLALPSPISAPFLLCRGDGRSPSMAPGRCGRSRSPRRSLRPCAPRGGPSPWPAPATLSTAQQLWPVETASAASFRSFDATVLETWRSRLKEEEKYLMRVEAVKATVVSEAGSVVWGGKGLGA